MNLRVLSFGLLLLGLLIVSPGAWAQGADQDKRTEVQRAAAKAAKQAAQLAALKEEMKPIAAMFEARSVNFTGGIYKDHAFRYQLLKPAKIQPGKKYPVVVYLHGAGERGDDNLVQLKHLPQWMTQDGRREKFECFLIAPQCPVDRRWGTIDWRNDQIEYTKKPAEEAQAVMKMLAQVKAEFPVDNNRVYLTGLSMGGYGSWELGWRRANVFAAVAPICGRGDAGKIDTLVGKPLWAWHGDADTSVPVEGSRAMIAALRAAGGEPKYTELPGVGHNSWEQAYKNEDGVIPWLFKQRR